jgi:hypothetical protein
MNHTASLQLHFMLQPCASGLPRRMWEFRATNWGIIGAIQSIHKQAPIGLKARCDGTLRHFYGAFARLLKRKFQT